MCIQIYYFLCTDHVLAGLASINGTTVSHDEIQIHFTISDNITCFINKERITARICRSLPAVQGDCESSDVDVSSLTDCKSGTVNGAAVTFVGLNASSTYCFRANVSYEDTYRILDATATTKKDVIPDHGHSLTTSGTSGVYTPGHGVRKICILNDIHWSTSIQSIT